MFTGITSHGGSISHAGALVTAVLVLTGTAILHGGTAAADSNQDDQFLALLDSEGIPALEGVPSLIDTAHRVCRAIDDGFSADAVVDAMVQDAYRQDPDERSYAAGRLARTEAKFVTAAVGAYCPYDRGKVAFTANPTSHGTESTHRGAVPAHAAVNSAGAALEPATTLDAITMPAPGQEPPSPSAIRLPQVMDGGVVAAGRSSGERAHGTVPGSRIVAVPSGDTAQTEPPEIPAPPPVARLRTPPEPIAVPPRPQQPAPRPQQPAPPPERPVPPPELPPPPPPPPAPPMAPGFVRLAP
ncbi:DUF732 domain-containing protein [Mycobacterium sp.]|uniref:DUF732 domain-containing protein n=1 Tax=Mycobacterium sp. TaxID=1785 RepID=UPI00262D0F54|nr:DUF732 domain-containing protein [Mycobacterium sp.]